MNPGKTLFKLGYAFKQSKIWKTIYEEELFAVDLDGEIGSYSLRGRNGQHIGHGRFFHAPIHADDRSK